MKVAKVWLIHALLIAATTALAAAQQSASLPPLPANPNGPVTGAAQVLTTPAERAAGLNLLNLARQDYTFGEQDRPDTTLVATLQSSGNLRFEGTGTMEEIWTRGPWIWFADFDNTSSGMPYALASNPVPLRVQMARQALLWPITGALTLNQIRVANATVQGQAATCVLVNRARVVANANGRSWLESEYCINSGGALLLASPAPGVYFIYDYDPALQFAGHTIASQINVIEGSTRVLQVQVTRLGPPNADDLNTLQAAGRHEADLMLPFAFTLNPRDGVAASVAVVHVSVAPSGAIQEMEVIPNGDSGAEAAALARMASVRFPPLRMQFQRELYVRVESH